MIDVGCGSGEFLDEFRKAGIPGHGIELADAGLRRCREKGLDVVKLDLTKAPSLPWEADLVYSFEVAGAPEGIRRGAPGWADQPGGP